MRHAIDIAAEACGSLTALSAAIGAAPSAVCNWRVRGVPIQWCAAVEQATKGAVRRWDLRPDDWHRIWPELVGSEGSPAAAEQAAA